MRKRKVSVPKFTIKELCGLSGLTDRQVRRATQDGTMPRPKGRTRAARYSSAQLDIAKRLGELLALDMSWKRARLHLNLEAKQPRESSRREEMRREWVLSIGAGVELRLAPEIMGFTKDQQDRLVDLYLKDYDRIASEKFG